MTTGEESDGAAVRATVLAGHTGDTPAARRALTHPSARVRIAALGALARLGTLDDEALGVALGDASSTVRRRAAEIAAQHPGVALGAALRDGDATVAEMAAWALGERGVPDDASLTTLVELAGTHADALVREAAVAALGAIGDVRGLPAILAGCTDKPAVRRRAVLALAPFDGPEVDAAIALALADRDWQVRQAAEDLVRATGGS